MRTQLMENYERLFEVELLAEMESVSVQKTIDQGQTLLDIGNVVRSMPLLLSGVIKILREDENGDELLLYFLEQGDTCAMTMNCCIGNSKSEIRAVAETDVELFLIPVQKMEEWIGKYKSWRKFVFDSYHNRFTELLETIDKLAFLKMDDRLLAYLKEKSGVNNNREIKQTHYEIAVDLHTSRVVVSRLLKKLENNGYVELHRNRIMMLDV
ncbi:MAG: Crp/Fnr family transcriptional regulator [Flavobacteriales bacterium]|nr:Crp/Fnr family transcriptional regulator [Flavobacteriales bacterium]